MHPDDTTWEDWASLQNTYHLENKVLPDGLGNDRPTTEIVKANSRSPKRRTTIPTHLKDDVYVGPWPCADDFGIVLA